MDQDVDQPEPTEPPAPPDAPTTGPGSESVSGPVVAYEVVDRVAHVTIDRPDLRNAMDLEVFDQLEAAARRVAQDPDIGAVVVAGHGGVFSAGIDVAALSELAHAGLDEDAVARLQEAFTAFEDLEVPTIAAIEGHCYGAGLQLALACHLRAVAPSAQLGLLEARWGLIPDLGGSWRLPRLVGLGRATELTLTARRVSADEARSMGLAEIALPDVRPLQAAHDLAAGFAAGPEAIRRAPRLLRENVERERAAALRAERELQVELAAGPDVREAITAHLQRRPPSFGGSVERAPRS